MFKTLPKAVPKCFCNLTLLLAEYNDFISNVSCGTLFETYSMGSVSIQPRKSLGGRTMPLSEILDVIRYMSLISWVLKMAHLSQHDCTAASAVFSTMTAKNWVRDESRCTVKVPRLENFQEGKSYKEGTIRLTQTAKLSSTEPNRVVSLFL